MKIFGVCDTVELAIGLRLGGIDAVYVDKMEDVIEKIEEASNDSSIGILLVSENVYNMAEKEIVQIKQTSNLPLIVKLPKEDINRLKGAVDNGNDR